MAWVLWLAGAVAAGVAGNLAYELAKHQTLRLPKLLRRRRNLPTDVRSFDSTALGMYPLVTWSRKRILDENTLRTSFVGRRSVSHLFDQPEWHNALEREREKGTAGDTAYIVAIEVDHGEHPGALSAGFVIAESDYAECMATLSVARSGRAKELTAVLSDDLEAFLARVPPKYDAEPGREEDVFALARRGLREELGLGPDECGEPLVTWLGWSEPAAGFYAVVLIRARLSEVEIEERRAHCHSVYEHDLVSWMPLTKSAVANVVRGGSSPDGRNPWIAELSPVVAMEAWRFRHAF